VNRPAAPRTLAPVAPAQRPPVYSAANPAPQRPDPYARSTLATGRVPVARMAGTSQNRNATIGFILGIVSTFALSIAAPVGIVFSILGIQQARRLKDQGVVQTGMVFALIGLAASVFAAIMGLVQVIAFIAALASFDVAVTGRIPGFGLLSYLPAF
jgi:hypothetical protein